MIYYCVFDSSEGENDRAYIAKKIRNSGTRRLISSTTDFITGIFNRILDHAESIPTTRKYGKLQRRHNLSLKSMRSKIIISAFAAMACQA